MRFIFKPILGRHVILAVFFWGVLTVAVPAHALVEVFSCEPEWASLTRELGGEKVNVYSATTAQQDVHRIQARPSLIAKMRKADMVVCTGADLEAGWLPLLLQRAANNKVLSGKPGHFMAADQVERLDVPSKLDRSEGDLHAGGNPHFHLDPNRVATVAKALSQRLIEIDGKNNDYYLGRYRQFEAKWQMALVRWTKMAEPLRGLPVVVHHKDWRYLLRWLGMQEVATLEPKPGIPPNASHLSSLQQQMGRTPATMILRTVYQDARPSQWLSERTGIPAIELPYTVGGNDRANDLLGLFEETISLMLDVVPHPSSNKGSKQ